MTESQLALKQILDQWTACTLSIEDAQVQLSEWVSLYGCGTDKPRGVLFGQPFQGDGGEYPPVSEIVNVDRDLGMVVYKNGRCGQYTEEIRAMWEHGAPSPQTQESAPHDYRRVFDQNDAALKQMLEQSKRQLDALREQSSAEETMERRDEKPVVFIESPRVMSLIEQQKFAAAFKEAVGDRYLPVVLVGGATLANQQEWRPERVDIKCGSISIKTRSSIGTLHGADVVIDGVDMPLVRKVSIDIDCVEPARVKIEFQP